MKIKEKVFEEFLGTGQYPIEFNDPETARIIDFFHGARVSVVKIKSKELMQDTIHSHQHSTYEFTMPFSGSPLLCQDAETLVLHQGMFLACNPDVLHGPAEKIKKSDFMAIQVKQGFLQDMAKSLFGSKQLVFDPIQIKPSQKFLNIIQTFTDESKSRDCGSRLFIENVEVQLAILILREFKHNFSKRMYNGEEVFYKGILKALECMHKNYDEHFDPDKLAKEACMSKYHFFRAFKEHTGKTPYKYLVQIRLEKSLELLANRALSITDISQILGFTDHSHYSNKFKEHFNLCPSEFREKINN